MAMEHGCEPPQWFPTRLDTNDCDSAIGELVLRGDAALLFAPTGALARVPFDYNATLLHVGGQLFYVRVVKAAAGQETRIVEGWREIWDEFGLIPVDVAMFNKMATHDRAFMAIFRDANRNDRVGVSRSGALDDVRRPSSPDFRVDMDRFRRAQGAEGSRGWQAAEAAGGGEQVLQGSDNLTIKEAMDLAVECGALEGSDEHYIATRLFVKAENRAMFLTFSNNAGRLQWLKRCYEESRIG